MGGKGGGFGGRTLAEGTVSCIGSEEAIRRRKESPGTFSEPGKKDEDDIAAVGGEETIDMLGLVPCGEELVSLCPIVQCNVQHPGVYSTNPASTDT